MLAFSHLFSTLPSLAYDALLYGVSGFASFCLLFQGSVNYRNSLQNGISENVKSDLKSVEQYLRNELHFIAAS